MSVKNVVTLFIDCPTHVTAGQTLHNENLYSLYRSPNISVIKPARIRDMRNAWKVMSETGEEAVTREKQ
jgi:transketolase